MTDNDGIPASDLIALIAQLRDNDGLRHFTQPVARQYMAGVAQGREQAAERIEELLREYGVEISQEVAR